MLARARYRTVQVLRQVSPRVSAEDRALVAAILPPGLLTLFERQRAGDQAHAVRVCRALIEQGYREPALLQAALLHDVGKIVGLPLPYRVAAVLLHRLAPRTLNWLATQGEKHRPLHPFAVSLAHPALGARLAAQAGADPTTVELIAQHQATRPEGELAQLVRALQRVDDQT